MDEELKPCPFCGGTDFEIMNEVWGHAILCEECGSSSGYWGSFDGAKEAWNRRRDS